MIRTQRMDEPIASLKRWHLVLIVDDDPQVLSALRRLLEREPYDVVTTDRPHLALEWVKMKPVSLVICDHRMPEMPGAFLLGEVSEKSPSTARVLLTAYPEAVSSIEAAARRFDCIVTKPWDDEMLKRTVRWLLHGREN